MTGIALLEYQCVCMSKLVSDDAQVAGLYITCILGLSMICLKWGMRGILYYIVGKTSRYHKMAARW